MNAAALIKILYLVKKTKRRISSLSSISVRR